MSEPRLRLWAPRGRKPVIKWFLSYAHDDRQYKDKFLTLFRPQLGSSRMYSFEEWSDAQIVVGENWRARIIAALEDAHLGVFLLSPSFLNSQFIKQVELERFIAGTHQAAEGKRSIPVLLRETNRFADFHGLDALLVAGKQAPFRTCRNRDGFVTQLVNSMHEMLLRYSDSSESPPKATPLPPALAAVRQRPADDIRHTVQPRRTAPVERGTEGQLRELFGFDPERQLIFLPNSQNQALRKAFGSWTPSEVTLEAAEDLAQVLANPKLNIRRPGEPIACDLAASHVVAFGFESSQPIYRQIAGYKELPKGRSESLGYLKSAKQMPFKLPWRSNLASRAQQGKAGEFYPRDVAGKKAQRRIWSLHRDGEVVRPKFESGRFVRDYISIVHVPSYLSDRPNRWLTLLAGIQANGTRALRDLLRDREVLSRIQKDAPCGCGWQAIIHVDLADHKRARLSVVDVARVDVNWPALDAWRKAPPNF